MSKYIGFRCPDEVVLGIERRMQVSGLDKTATILEMLNGLISVNVEKRKALPEIEAVYLVWTDNELLYIGQTANLRSRFVKHHRLVDFLNHDSKIAWFDTTGCNRLEVEEYFIKAFSPKLNGETVGRNPGDKVPLGIHLEDRDREILESLATKWGLSLSRAIRRLIQESKENNPNVHD